MAGDLEMNDGEGSGPFEVGSWTVNLDKQIGAQSEQCLKEVVEVVEEAPVVEEVASTGTDIAISEKHDGIDNEKAADVNDMIIETVNDERIIDASFASKYGEATEIRPVVERKRVLNADAAPWTPKDLEQSRALLSKSWELSLPSTKKLLVLDVNGLLVARYSKLDRNIIPHGAAHRMVSKSFMFKRPFCDSFLKFCFENFHVGVWSSMIEVNVRRSLDYICKKTQHKFLFVMHQGDCTDTGLRNPEKKASPLFLKELTKVWSRFPKGQFNETNTLLIDDTPYKALWNPPYTAIFPEAYWYNEADNFLETTLPEYLKRLRDATDVREFVRAHPIGEPAIAPGCLHWDYYQKVLKQKPQADALSPLPTSPPVTFPLQTQMYPPGFPPAEELREPPQAQVYPPGFPPAQELGEPPTQIYPPGFPPAEEVGEPQRTQIYPPGFLPAEVVGEPLLT